MTPQDLALAEAATGRARTRCHGQDHTVACTPVCG